MTSSCRSRAGWPRWARRKRSWRPPRARSISILAALGDISQGSLLGPLIGLISSVIGIVLSFAFAPFFIFYLVIDTRTLVAAFDRGIPPAWRPDVWAVIRIADRAFKQWLKATVIQGLIMGTLSGLAMFALSLFFGAAFSGTALIIAVIAGFSEFIPLIGPIFPLVGATLVGLTVSPAAAISAFVVFAILQQLEANVVAPRVEGQALALHPALIIAALILGAAAAGLAGALLATVVTSIVMIISRYLFRRERPHRSAAPAARARAGAARRGAGPGDPTRACARASSSDHRGRGTRVHGARQSGLERLEHEHRDLTAGPGLVRGVVGPRLDGADPPADPLITARLARPKIVPGRAVLELDVRVRLQVVVPGRVLRRAAH